MTYNRTNKGLEALCYLDDIAHGRKMKLDAHELKLIVEKELKALEIIKETWGDSILCDIKKGFILGCPYTKLPNKEKLDLLKEVLS